MNWKDIKDIIRKELKEAKRPDYPDIDGDGDRKEPMSKAFKDKKKSNEEVTDKEEKNLKKISKELNKASKMHKGQSDRIKKITKEATVTADNTKFNLRTGVNKNPTKLGIKIQFEPMGGGLDPEIKSKLEVALQEKLNLSLAEYDIQISKDTDIPRDDVIGFFIPLSQLKNLIVQSLTGKKAPKPTVPAPVPTDSSTTPTAPLAPMGEDEQIEEMIKEHLIKEMKVGTLNEISKVVSKEDFYEFINKGNNIIRTLEENEFSTSEAKNYLKYLVKHNIM